ncbi:MAG: hypothetical protein FWH21_01440 [Kiritimatiellaeota bacterium]|nr:hypothetical protein [Kiritimatiellota bacterium]
MLTPKAESPRACVEKAQALACGGSPPCGDDCRRGIMCVPGRRRAGRAPKTQPLECGGLPPLFVAGACPRAVTIVGGGSCVCSVAGARGEPRA